MAITTTHVFNRIDDTPVTVHDVSFGTSYSKSKTKNYTYDCVSKKEDPSVIVKWCRRNFGERAVGWDFVLIKGTVILTLWDPKFITMYEMWYR